MIKNLTITLVLFFSALVVNAQTQTAKEILKQIHVEYAQRFDSTGKYINDLNLTTKFRASQLNAIQILRQNKMLGQSFQIRNSAMADLVITAYVVQENNSNFAGLLIERNQYASADSESLLRLFDFSILTKGMDLLRYNNRTVMNLKIDSLSVTTGGTLILKFPTDFNNNQYSQTAITLVQTPAGFTFKTAAGDGFSVMNMDIWYSIFSENFGVNSVTFQ